MKALTIVLSVVAALLLGLIATFLIGGALKTEALVSSVEAQSALEEFETATQTVSTGGATQMFAQLESDDASAYKLVDATVTFRNNGLFDAEWLTFFVEPGEGDVAVYSQNILATDIPARTSVQINLKLLTKADSPDSGRRLLAEYYVLGMRRTVDIPIETQ